MRRRLDPNSFSKPEYSTRNQRLMSFLLPAIRSLPPKEVGPGFGGALYIHSFLCEVVLFVRCNDGCSLLNTKQSLPPILWPTARHQSCKDSGKRKVYSNLDPVSFILKSNLGSESIRSNTMTTHYWTLTLNLKVIASAMIVFEE